MIPYNITTDFSEDEADIVGGRSTVRTAALDAEFAAIQATTDGMINNVGYLLDDDGTLINNSVHLSSLAFSVFESSLLQWKGQYAVGVYYAVGDIVYFQQAFPSASFFKCTVVHTSSSGAPAPSYFRSLYDYPYGIVIIESRGKYTISYDFDRGYKYSGALSAAPAARSNRMPIIQEDIFYHSGDNAFSVYYWNDVQNKISSSWKQVYNKPTAEAVYSALGYTPLSNSNVGAGSGILLFSGECYKTQALHGISGITSGAVVIARHGSYTEDHSSDEISIDGCEFMAGSIVPGDGFTIMATAKNGRPLRGEMSFNYLWINP